MANSQARRRAAASAQGQRVLPSRVTSRARRAASRLEREGSRGTRDFTTAQDAKKFIDSLPLGSVVLVRAYGEIIKNSDYYDKEDVGWATVHDSARPGFYAKNWADTMDSRRDVFGFKPVRYRVIWK